MVGHSISLAVIVGGVIVGESASALNLRGGAFPPLVASPNETSTASGSTPLNEFGFLMTHDSATGYLNNRRRLTDDTEVLGGVKNDWAVTQSTGFSGQLACGARAFDLRPYQQDDGSLIMHHGSIKVDHSLMDAVQEVVDWANSNTDELVLLYLSHFDGSSTCETATKDAMASLGIHVASCTELAGLTVDGAKSLGALSGGGHVLAMDGCVSENYDSSITCYKNPFSAEEFQKTAGGDKGADGGVEFLGFETCYGDDMTTRDNLYAYMDKVTAITPASDGTLSMAQGHWQSDAYSVTAGTLSGSSLLKDEEWSQLNSVLASKKVAGYAHVNLLEVDNVCDGGLELLASIRART